MDSLPLNRCLCCNCRWLKLVVDLGEQVPANAVHDALSEQERYPLRMYRCRDCGHFQLDRSLDPAELYKDYPYATGQSKTMEKHLEGLAAWIGPNKNVVEIGCNDGTLLRAMRDRGCKVIGVDPATTFNRVYEAYGFDVRNEPWSDQIAASLEDPADVVVGTNVLAHMRNPKDALQACNRVLEPGGMAIFEVHSAESVIAKNQFDTIYHEHLSYFTPRSAMELANGTAFVLQDLVRIPIHGGSFRLTFVRGHEQLEFPDPGLLYDPEHIKSYIASIRMRQKKIRDILKPGTICIGASARASVMLQKWQPPISAAIDDAETKQGKYVAGTQIPIKSFDWLQEHPPKQVLMGAWNLYDTFRPRLAKMLPGVQLISHYPEVKVETL